MFTPVLLGTLYKIIGILIFSAMFIREKIKKIKVIIPHTKGKKYIRG